MQNTSPSQELLDRISAPLKPSEDLLRRIGLGGDLRNIDISETRIQNNMPALREAVSYWRAYPDKFVDFLAGPNSKFRFYSYQRIMLRATCRHTYSFMTFPRAYSKSFISFLSLIIKCILYPGAQLFTTTAGKQQATNIATEKINELVELLPALKKEIDWTKTSFAKDTIRVVFHNGSRIDVMAAQQTTRGARRHGGLIEEASKIA